MKLCNARPAVCSTGIDAKWLCLLAVALLEYLLMTLSFYLNHFYEAVLVLPCLLFVGLSMAENRDPGTKRRLGLSFTAVLWFLFLQLVRNIRGQELHPAGLFLCTYLFAFPLASLLRDGEEKKGLKLFAGAYLAASFTLTVYALLLLGDAVPGWLAEDVYWDGSRLKAGCHPNISACILMIGMALCLTFLLDSKKKLHRLALSAVLALHVVAIGLTNSRTVILLTGVLMAGAFFFGFRKNTWPRFFLSIGISCAIVVGLFLGSGQIFRLHSQALLEKYTQAYYEEVQPAETEAAPPAELPEAPPAEEIPAEAEYEGEAYIEEEVQEESDLPIEIDPETGDISLKVESYQGDLRNDLKTLNGRFYIWEGAFLFLKKNPSALFWGTPAPGPEASFFCPFYVTHTHNSWVESLLNLGLPGFAAVVVFTVLAVWNALAILWKHSDDVWKRMVALLTLCILVASFMEPYLFISTYSYHFVDMLFFLCTGYMTCWQSKENHQLLAKLRAAK